MDLHYLEGRIVFWPHDHDNKALPLHLQYCQHGQIVQVFGTHLLVEIMQDEENPAPPMMVIIDAFYPPLQFFDSMREYEIWSDWVDSLHDEAIEVVEVPPPEAQH